MNLIVQILGFFLGKCVKISILFTLRMLKVRGGLIKDLILYHQDNTADTNIFELSSHLCVDKLFLCAVGGAFMC